MPHVILEYSDNIPAEINFSQLFAELHLALVIIANADIAACKSRAYLLHDFYLGDGKANNAMAHVNITLLAGRSIEIKQKLNDACITILKKYFLPVATGLNLQLTSNINEIAHDTYQKFIN